MWQEGCGGKGQRAKAKVNGGVQGWGRYVCWWGGEVVRRAWCLCHGSSRVGKGSVAAAVLGAHCHPLTHPLPSSSSLPSLPFLLEFHAQMRDRRREEMRQMRDECHSALQVCRCVGEMAQ